MNREATVKQALAAGPLTADEIAEQLHVQEYEELRKIRHTLTDLERRGLVAREPQEPKYRLLVRGSGQVQRKIWKALLIRGACTPKQAALLAECTRDYARRYLYWLAKAGWVLRDEGSAICRVNPEQAGTPPHWARVKAEKGGQREKTS